jgi:hypothetical protein
MTDYKTYHPQSPEGIKILEANKITFEELDQAIEWPVKLGISKDGVFGSVDPDYKEGDPIDCCLWIMIKEQLGHVPKGTAAPLFERHKGKVS